MKNYLRTSLDEYLKEIASDKFKKINDQIRNKNKKRNEIRRKLNDETNNIKRRIIQNQLKQLFYEIEELKLKKKL